MLFQRMATVRSSGKYYANGNDATDQHPLFSVYTYVSGFCSCTCKVRDACPVSVGGRSWYGTRKWSPTSLTFKLGDATIATHPETKLAKFT